MMSRTIILSLCTLVLVLALPSGAHAKHEAVHRQLLAYDTAPDRAALVDAAAPTDAADALMAVHGDPARPRIVRLRALDALGLFPSLAVRGYLHRLTADPASDALDRMHAGTALVFAFGDGALTSVRPLLQDAGTDGAVVVAVADALVRYAGPAGRALVRDVRRAAGKDPRRMDALDRVLVPRENVAPMIR